MSENELQKNADRFLGFADTYEDVRPKVPMYPINVICKYLGKNPESAVDLGCGTGLSTMVWVDVCKNVIGIEPSNDMIRVAKNKNLPNTKFIQAFSNDTGLDDNCADAVVCSQSFHWMEPKSTLKEINRILKDGGVFATIDCDWPPVTDWRAEKAYMDLYSKVKKLESELDDVKSTFAFYSKDKHLQNIKESGYFRYSRELLFANTEKCTAERFIGIILSQGSFQAVWNKHRELLEDDLEKFKTVIYDIFGKSEFDIDFCYRMRVAVK